MAKDSSLYARRAGLVLLANSAALQALVGARIYPPQRPPEPVWPFVAWGVAIAGAFEASCMDGSEINVAVHAYASTEGEGAQTVPGEERATEIAALVAAVLSDAGEIDLVPHGCPYPATAHFTWVQTQVIQDGSEADDFHAVTTFRINVVS